MKRFGVSALALSLLIHTSVLFIIAGRDFWNAQTGEPLTPLKASGRIHLVDTASLPAEESALPTVEQKQDRPASQESIGNGYPEEHVTEMELSGKDTPSDKESSLATAGFPREELPPGGDYPSPLYPERARKEGREGSVVLLIHVDQQGNPERVEVEQVLGGSDFARAVLKSVKKWRFPEESPATYRKRFLFRIEE